MNLNEEIERQRARVAGLESKLYVGAAITYAGQKLVDSKDVEIKRLVARIAALEAELKNAQAQVPPTRARVLIGNEQPEPSLEGRMYVRINSIEDLVGLGARLKKLEAVAEAAKGLDKDVCEICDDYKYAYRKLHCDKTACSVYAVQSALDALGDK